MDAFVRALNFMGKVSSEELAKLQEGVRAAVPRIAEIGQWPSYINGEKSLVSRVPGAIGNAPGFDAGIACALDMIPRDKQRLAATLHAAYTETAVEQVRREVMSGIDPDSETCWWLAACNLCEEGLVNSDAFLKQLEAFRELSRNPEARRLAAMKSLSEMMKNFKLMNGIPFVIKDGGLQGAYLFGYDWGVQYAEAYCLFFIGTFRESLGLESFEFSTRLDAENRTMSGPVHGSQQFVKVSSFDELAAALAVVQQRLGLHKK